MTTHFTKLLLPACLLALTSGLTLADGLADRATNDRGMDSIERIHQSMGPTAAGRGPGASMAPESVQMDTGSRYPANVTTAHQRKRYIFDSNRF